MGYRSLSLGIREPGGATRQYDGGVVMPLQKPLIVVVDDDPGVLKLVSVNLQLEDFRVMTGVDGKEAVQLVRDEQPSLVLLDIMMPVMDGFQACERIREFCEVPIIMLTAKGSIEDIVRGLDTGADDYVVKPFSINELVARVKAVLHRTKFPQEIPQPAFAAGDLSIDYAQHQVKIGDNEIVLPPTEYRILCLLARNAGRVITHEQLLTEVWGREYRGDTHILQVAVARLRKRLDDDPGNPRYIATRPGIGYTFKKPRDDSFNGSLAYAVAQQAQG
jgi:DNA-binding response OmpR family regulator